MAQSAVAYLAKGNLVIAPVVRTPTGLGLEIDPTNLGTVRDQGSIAAALAYALADSDRVVPHPAQNEWKGFFQPFLAAVGVRSHKAFMEDAQRVSIRIAEDQLKLTSQRNLGSKDGFEAISDAAIFVPLHDFNAAAAALLSLLK